MDDIKTLDMIRRAELESFREKGHGTQSIEGGG